MEKTIKYLENGEYHYATVKDVGDLAKLKTDSKDDLVTAINELFITGGEAPKKPDGYDKLVDNVADAIQKQQQMTDTITNMQQSAQLSDAEMEHMKQVQEELHQEYLKAIKELNEAVDKAEADAADLDKKTSDLQDKLDETFASVDKEVSDVHKQLDCESAGLRKDLDDTKTSLESTRKDLLNNTQEFGVVNSEVKELKDKMDRRIWSTDLDPVREQVNKNTTEVSQTKDELKNKADQSSLDLVTNSVENLSTQIKENAEGLKVAVKRDELGGDVARLLNDKTNLLLGTRSFSGEDNWKNRDTATIEPGYYKGLKSAAIQSTDSSIYQPYHIKANTAYTFSFFGKEDKDNPKATLIIKPIDAPNINIDNAEQPVHITTEWQRFAVTFSADQDCDISIQIIQGPEASNNILHLAGFKLQYGQNNTPWEPNEADVAENIEHNESQFNVYSDQIAGIVKKQEKMGDTERQLDTRITETAEGLKQTSKDLQDANGKITEFKGQLESTARGLKTEYEKYTNDAIGQISDSSLNLIRNSAFQNKDDNFAQWQNVSAKVNIREDDNGLRWVELTQSGMTTDNPQGITSNYFVIKQGKVTVAVDIKSGDKAELDNESVLFLELYDNAKKRVDFHWVTLSNLGLSKSLLNDHQVHRGLYRLAIDRTDAQYMTVKAHLIRNGDLWFTNFSARLSSIDDGGYTPNPDDVNQQILKQNTKIEQNAKEVAIKANSVDVTRDIKSAVDGIQVGGRNLLLGTSTTEKSGKSYDFAQYSIAGGLKPNTTYTFSGWARVDQKAMDNKQNVFVCAYTNDWSWSGWLNIAGSLTAKYNKITFTTPTGKSFSPVVMVYLSHPNNDNSKDSLSGIGFISRLKLEEGNKATDWTPAPEDTSEEIKSAKEAAIQVASDQINIHVNELSTSFDDKLDKCVNEVKTASEKFTTDGIEQTVTKITDVKNSVDRLGDKVDNIQVGGRNLLTNTDKDISITSHTTDGWPAWANVDTGFSFEHGKTYTFSTEARNSTDKITEASIRVFEYSTNTQVGIYAFPADGKRHSITFSIPNDSHDYHLLFYAGHAGIIPGVDVTTTYHHPKLEEGNVATDWTPAPEDVDSKFQYKEVTGAIDFNDFKTQQKIFYKDTQARNSPAGSNYWYFLNVDVVPGTARIIQTATSDRNNITWKRTFADSWTAWQKQATQGDVDALRTETTASVKNLGDRVTTEVNSITTKVNSNNGGGINLLRGTGSEWKTLTGSVWFCQTTGAGAVELGSFTTGDTVTYSITVRNNSQYAVRPEIVGFSDDNGTRSFNISGTESIQPGETKTVSVSATVAENTVKIIGWLISSGSEPTFSVDAKNEKLERGSVATPWSPAPEDTAEAIKTLNTKWDVANGQIQGKVTATDVNNILNGKGYATQSWAQTMFTMKSDAITLQAVRDNITNGIQNQVNDQGTQISNANTKIADTNTRLDNLRVGGTNLLKGTSNIPRTLRGGGWLAKSTANDVLTSVDGYHAGDQFTYSATITNNSSRPVSLEMWLFKDRTTSINQNSHSMQIPAHAQDQRVSATITITEDTKWVRNYIIYSDGQGQDSESIVVSNEKFEFGNVATSWTPNPNDGGSGVNLLRGTADFSWPDGIGENGTVNKSYEKFDDMTVALHISGNNSGIYTKWGRAFPDGQIQVGEQYTFSFDIKGTGTFSMVKNESESVNIASGIPVTSDYQRVKVTGTVKALDQAFVIYFQGAYDVHIKNVKIERGTIATPWTPHPFDEKNKGINLLKSTAYWNPNDWNHISDNVWYDDNWVDSNGHKAYGHHTAWQGLGQTVYVTPGVYTWSAQIYLNGLDSNDFVYPYMGDSQYNGTVQVQDIRKPMLGVNDQNKWINYSTTFYVKNAGNLCVRPELNRDHGTIHVGSQKLEHGMVATPWSPSPLDDKTATITLDSADINSMKTQGHYFVKNLANSPIAGWVYVDVTGNNNNRLKQEVYQDNGYEHRSRRWTGSYWTEWTTDVNNKNVISQINITPDQITIASNKIEIDGNTKIHGVLDVKQVTLQGKSGYVDLSGDGINIAKNNGAGMNIGANAIQITSNTNGQAEVEGVITPAWSSNNVNQNGIGLILTTEQELGRPYGGDILTIGTMPKSGVIHSAMVFDATGITSTYKKGFNWFAPHTLNGDGGVFRFPNAQDDLVAYAGNIPGSRQEGYSQPTLALVHGKARGSAGLQFQWDDLVPFGRITSSMSYVSAPGTAGNDGITVGWYSYGAWYGDRRAPCIIYHGSDGSNRDGGIVFYPGGEVCFWQGDFHSNLRWSGIKNTD